MKRKNTLIIFLDIFQIIISLITFIVAIYILINDNHDFTKITFIAVSLISIIMIIYGLGNMKTDYRIYKKFSLI